MKIRDLMISLAAVAILATGCGNQTDNPQKNDIISKKVNLPVIGIASNVSEGFFTLVTMPEKYGDPNGKANINTTQAKIEDPDGKPAKIVENATVTVDGSYGDNEIVARSVIVNSAPKSEGITLKMPDSVEVPTAGMIRNFVGDKVPADFQKGWKLSDTGTLAEKPGSIIYQYTKGQWKLLLMRDPKSVNKFTVTLYSDNKVIWSGIEDKEGKLQPSK